MHYQTQTFFRPDEVKRESVTLRADMFNASRRLLGRSPKDCVFVPIRAMQFLGVICEDEVIFVDSQAYAVRDGEGGRMIVLAWQAPNGGNRNSLTDPVPIDVVHYHEDQHATQTRLMCEFLPSMNLLLERQHEEAPDQSAKIVSITSQP
ncbi:MAG: hypothetical protein ACPG4N_08105 [Gammaproteobacteria bacterium]